MTVHLTYRGYIARQLIDTSRVVADLWLDSLQDLVSENKRDIFPTDTYLDHIPLLIEEIGRVLASGELEVASNNPVVAHKAAELGRLRFEQDASVLQLLREYDRLSDILESEITRWSADWHGEFRAQDCLSAMARVQATVRQILHATVDTFVVKYRQQLTREREKLFAFNAFVSHELRQPLQAASLYLELLQTSESVPENEDRENLDDAIAAVGRASAMLADLSQSMHTASDQSIDAANQPLVDIVPLLQEIARPMLDAAAEHGVDIQIPENLGSVKVHRAKLQLIVTNLLSNAVKYRDPAKTRRYVRIWRDASTDVGSLALVFEDNGIGIDPALHDKMFELRARAGDKTSRAVDGQGLGLYLVAETVRELGGIIELDSVPGQGTRITLTLPDAVFQPA